RRISTLPAGTIPQFPRYAQAGAAFLALTIFPTRLIQEANPDWRLASWALALQVAGLTLAAIYLAGGSSWLRHFAFPICFFLIAVPWPSDLEKSAIEHLTRWNAAAVMELLRFWGIPAIQAGNVIKISKGAVGIDDACSGVRSFQAAIMLSLF